MSYFPNLTEIKVATGRFRASTWQMGSNFAGDQIGATLFNGVGSDTKIILRMVKVDSFLLGTTYYAVSTQPQFIRVHKVTTQVANGFTLAKVSKDSSGSSNALIEARGQTGGEFQAGGGFSATNRANTALDCLTQVFMPRLYSPTGKGYEIMDSAEVLEGANVILRPGEGIEVSFGNFASSDPKYVVTIEWWEVPLNQNVEVKTLLGRD